MKKSVRLLSILLAMVLTFSCFSVGTYAAYADYSHPAGYDALDHPYISAYQCSSMILDKVDEMLAEQNLVGDIDAKVVSTFHYDLTSIDKTFDSLIRLFNHDLYKKGKGLLDLGDLENINIASIKTAPTRVAVGRTDMEVLLALFGFLRDNKDLIGKIVDGKWDNGGLVSSFLDVNATVGDVHQMIKDTLYNALFEDRIAEGGTVVCTTTSTLDAMVNEFIYTMLVEGDMLPSFEKVLVEAGAMSDYGLANFSMNKISVYDLFRYALRAAIEDYGRPMLTELLLDNDSMLPLITGLLEIDIEQSYVDETTGETVTMTTEEYIDAIVSNILDLRNGALSKFISITDDGISLTTNFQNLLSQLLDTAKGLLATSLTSYDTVDSWTEEEMKNLTEPQVLACLVRTILIGMVDYADIPKTMPVRQEDGTVTEEPINGYALATYMMINVMGDKMPEKDYYGMIENYKNNATDGEQLNPGQEPVLERDSNGVITKYVEPAALTVLADYAYYFLNGKTTMDIPEGKNFDETLQWIFNWAIRQWGGLFRTNNMDLTTPPTLQNMVVWKNLDALLWESILDITWLPDDYVASFKDSNGNYTGNVTRSLLLDDFLYTLINLDMSQLNSMLNLFHVYKGTIAGYPKTSELDQDVIQFVLTFVKRILNGLFQSNSALFAGTSITCLEDLASKTEISGKTNLRILVENLCTLLPTYGQSIMTSALVLIAESLVDTNGAYEASLQDYPKNGETFTIQDLKDKVAAQRPSNKLSEGMMSDPDYFFFGGEDFDPLYKYYNYKDIYKEATNLIDRYDDETAALEAGEITERTISDSEISLVTYRLGYYYDKLSLRDADVSQLLREINVAKEELGYGEYGSATASGTRFTSTQFTLKTWKYYNTVLDFANSVYKEYLLDDSGTLRQSKISAARELLILAKKTLKFFGESADYTALDRQISLALARLTESQNDPGLYMPETIENLLAVYNEATKVDRGYDGDDQNIIDEATVALEAALEELVYQPQLAKVSGKTTVLDKEENIIYGVSEKVSNYMTYVRVLGVGIMQVTNGAGGNGTGTTIALDVDDNIVQKYTVVVFGDIDGDCRADACDANLIYAYCANLIPEDKQLSTYAMMAADANADGNVDTLDAYYLRQSGMTRYTVNQRGA
ncbi:MAG: dockerin type I domain-containing protein [Acutalibacteraceae bacterium]